MSIADQNFGDPRIGVRGIRTNLGRNIDVEHEVDLTVAIHTYTDRDSYALSGEKHFQIIEGGVTGHESFSIESMERFIQKHGETDDAPGWTACAGTEGRWDKLVIPFTELLKILFVAECDHEWDRSDDNMLGEWDGKGINFAAQLDFIVPVDECRCCDAFRMTKEPK